jgi:hypothetical protein
VKRSKQFEDKLADHKLSELKDLENSQPTLSENHEKAC